MGIAEIQAAFAASQPAAPNASPFGPPAQASLPPALAPAPAPAPFAVPLAPAQPGPGFPPAANPFQAPAAPVVLQGHVGPLEATQGAFAFTPPAGFQPASAPPINPVGERQSLNTAAPIVEAPVAPAVVEPVVEAPKRRTRKAKADAVIAGAVAEVEKTFDPSNASVEDEPMRGSAWTTEELCDFLTLRGYVVRLERA
jgi:hypothetical protein